jgi:hypothetical protein
LPQAELANFRRCGAFALPIHSFSLSLKITIPICWWFSFIVRRRTAGLDFSLKVSRRIAGLDFSSRFQPAVSALSFSPRFQPAISARSFSR